MKLLAEWFWVDRWTGSSAFLLSIEERGLYREMLSAAWRRGARLPADPIAIQRAIGCTQKEWKRCWPKVRQYWRLDGDEIVNDTQAEIYAEAMAAQQRASDRGKSGAEKRWGHTSRQCSGNAQASLGQKPPSPSPIDPLSKDQREDLRARADAVRAGSFCEWYEDKHSEVFGIGYMGSQRDYQKALELCAKFTDAEMRDAALVWFGMEDDFAKNGTRSIPKFASRISHCLQIAREVA